MNTIVEKIRNLISDILRTDGQDSWTYESITSSKVITLTESNVVASSILVYKNGSLWDSSNYTYSSTNNKLTITGSISVGDTLLITYNYYLKYSLNELQGFIKSAIFYLAVEKYCTYTIKSDDIIFPTPSEIEEDLIAVIASILIKGDITSYRTPELSISFERGDSKEKKIHKFVRQMKKTYGYLNYIKYDEKIVPEDTVD